MADWRTRELTCALHLGDILDGFCPKARDAPSAKLWRLVALSPLTRPAPQDASEEALRRVLDAFDALGRPVRHCLGNHCLTNLPRATLNARLECVLRRPLRGDPP